MRPLLRCVSAGLAGMALGAVVPTMTADAGLSKPATNVVPKLLASLQDPAATANDGFGLATAVSGTTVAVSAPSYKEAAEAVYLYVKKASGWPSTPTTTLEDPAATANDAFGWSVALSGNTLVVGASGTESFTGAAYVYTKSTSGWPTTPTVTLSDPGGTAGDQFGHSVSVSGKTIVVGADGPIRLPGLPICTSTAVQAGERHRRPLWRTRQRHPSTSSAFPWRCPGRRRWSAPTAPARLPERPISTRRADEVGRPCRRSACTSRRRWPATGSAGP